MQNINKISIRVIYFEKNDIYREKTIKYELKYLFMRINLMLIIFVKYYYSKKFHQK